MPTRTLRLRRSGRLAVLALLVLAPSPARAGDRADPAAVRRLLDDPSPSARAAAVRRLAGVEEPSALPVLYGALSDPHPYVRRAAAGVLGGAVAEEVRRRVAAEVPRLKDPTARLEACRAFALWADEPGWAALRRSLGDGAAAVRGEAARWLAEDPAPETAERLFRALSDPDGSVRAEAVDALGARPDGPDPLAMLGDPDPRVRIAALDASTNRAGEPAVRGVLRGLEDDSWSARLLAAERAARTRDRRVLPALVLRLEDARARVAEVAHASLVALTGIPFDPDRATWTGWLEGDGRSFDPAAEEPVERPAFAERSSRTVETARFLDLPIRSRFVGFVIDASGSMAEPMAGAGGATRWDVVKRELLATLGRLEGATGNVYCFADAVERAFPRAVPLGASRRAEVAAWLAKRSPQGRTALYDGLEAALGDPALDTVVVLSDGAPSAGAFFTKTDLLSEVRRLNRRRRARIDVISVGGDGIAARWRDVLERIASESGGVCVRR